VPGGLRAWREAAKRQARHGRQHEAVARLGHLALRDHELRTLMDEVVITVADILDVELSGCSSCVRTRRCWTSSPGLASIWARQLCP
jgi:hypothetical protein